MRQISFVGTCVIAVFVMSAVAAGSASANLTLLTAGGGNLVNGSPIEATSSNLVLTTAVGNLECSSNVLTGTDKTNVKPTDAAELNTAAFTGTEVFGADTNLCKTTTPFGPAKIASNNLPWTLKLKETGVAIIATGMGTKLVRVEAMFPASGATTCIFAAKKVTGRFVPGAASTPAPVEITIANQAFKLQPGSTAGCPKEGKLNGLVTTKSGTATLQSEL